MPRPCGIKWWCCLTPDVCQSKVSRVHPVGGRRVRPAGWMAHIDRATLLKAAAACFRWRPGRGHIVAAFRTACFGCDAVNDIADHCALDPNVNLSGGNRLIQVHLEKWKLKLTVCVVTFLRSQIYLLYTPYGELGGKSWVHSSEYHSSLPFLGLKSTEELIYAWQNHFVARYGYIREQ